MCLSQCVRIHAGEPIYAYKVLRVFPSEKPKEIMSDREWGQCIEPKTRLMSLYQNFIWEQDTIAESPFPNDEVFEDDTYVSGIGKGFFHSFKNADDAVIEALNYKAFQPLHEDTEILVFKVEIPEDSVVFEGSYNGSISYASNKLKLCGALIYNEKEVIDRLLCGRRKLF